MQNCLYPLPTTLVGVTVDGKPNFLTIAHVGIVTPTMVSLGMNKVHFSNAGIREHGVFSINIPSVELLRETDACGLISGSKADKASLFDVFYGELEKAPMIEQCPVNMECRLVQTVDFITHELFVAEIAATHCDEDILDDGSVDFGRIRPLLFVMNDRSYWELGNKLAPAWNVGRELRDRLKHGA